MIGTAGHHGALHQYHRPIVASGSHTPESSPGVFATPRSVTDLGECDFYHSMDIPGYGAVEGEWDLRGGEAAYLGHVDLRGKRVLEIGTASGFMCFHMERAGAEVVAYDITSEHSVDVVPYAGSDHAELVQTLKTHIGRLNNGYWLAHRAHGSQANVVYGTVYDVPAEIGTFDVATFGSVLLHLRDPFLALQNVLAHTTETVVVTDLSEGRILRLPLRFSNILGRVLFFRPDAATREPPVTWWRLTPQLVQKMIAVLGFEQSDVTYHTQLFKGRKRDLFTVVGRRTQPPVA
jgi:hypothetical protein